MTIKDLGKDRVLYEQEPFRINTKEEKRNAALVCADNATDPEDLRILLKALGLMDVR